MDLLLLYLERLDETSSFLAVPFKPGLLPFPIDIFPVVDAYNVYKQNLFVNHVNDTEVAFGSASDAVLFISCVTEFHHSVRARILHQCIDITFNRLIVTARELF